MTLVTLKAALLWSLIINYGVLILWVFLVVVARNRFFRISSSLFHVSGDVFDAVNYGGIAAYKCCIIFFNSALK